MVASQSRKSVRFPVSESGVDKMDITESKEDVKLYKIVTKPSLFSDYINFDNVYATGKYHRNLTETFKSINLEMSTPSFMQWTEKGPDKVEEQTKANTPGHNTISNSTYIISNNSSFLNNYNTMDNLLAIFHSVGSGSWTKKTLSGEMVLDPLGKHGLHSLMTSSTDSVDSKGDQELSSGNLRKAYQGKDDSSARFSGTTNIPTASQVSVSLCLR